MLALGMVYADPFELDSISLFYNTTAVSNELGNLYTSGNNLTNTYTIKGIFNNWGGVSQSEVDVDEMIPTVAFHGQLDSTVFIDSDNSFLHYTLDGSRAIHYNLIAHNICSDITIDTTGGHGVYRNASSVFRAGRASCFFKSVFCNSCTTFYTTDSIPSNCSTLSGIHDYNVGPTVTVYPNPVENILTIDGVSGTLDLIIYNSFGQIVFNAETMDGKVSVDLSTGLYLLTIKQIASNKSYTTKFIKN